ncbi:hypothetical protein [Microbacterium resistens]|uniref:hypothetical protein n=1 Tax=Microbacterium resistens TaxID=156977 RepID=UPI00366DAFBA
MGTNRRYAHVIDRERDEQILARWVATAGPLQSLTPDELDLANEPVTIAPKPPHARAWVRFGAQPAKVDCVVERWTEKACGVSFTVQGKTYRCWVWSNAVMAPAPRGGQGS